MVKAQYNKFNLQKITFSET